MWLADTSVWIDHFRVSRNDLSERLEEGMVLMHPCVLGELACGNLKDRKAVLADLMSLPSAIAANDDEVMHLVGKRKLWGRGVGWVDVQLVASSFLSPCRLWTLDRKLAQAAGELGLK